jgi:putative acetyltransferase
MIREATADDFADIRQIRLESAAQAHWFLPREFWEQQVEQMPDAPPREAEIWVLEQGGEVRGFCWLQASRLEVMVATCCQGVGLGSRLLDFVKDRRPALEAAVFADNDRAVAFLRHHGFEVLERHEHAEMGKDELTMQWRSRQSASA